MALMNCRLVSKPGMTAQSVSVRGIVVRYFYLLSIVFILGICSFVSSSEAAGARHPDFSGLWVMGDPYQVVKPDEDGDFLTFDSNAEDVAKAGQAPDFSANFTEETKRRRQYFLSHYDKTKDDQVNYCVSHGMPWIMTSRGDYLIDIYQTKDRVTMLFEGMDVHRLIHFNESVPPPSFTPSTNGYSIAYWDGDTLVIETSALSERNVIGLKQRSNQARVTERWKLIQHPKFGKAVDIDLTVVDPVVYLKPAKGHQLLIQAPPGSTLNMYSCNETLWEKHVRELEEQGGHR
ncbi:MAG: hypothetical protein AB7T07_00330 [Steroidobacteraceae bacterium]